MFTSQTEAKARDDRNALASSKPKSSPETIVYGDPESMERTPKTRNMSSSSSMTSTGNVNNDSTPFSKILKFRSYATDEEGVKHALARDRDDGGGSFDEKGTDGSTGHRRAYRYNLTPLPAAKGGSLRADKDVEDVEDDTSKGKRTRTDIIEDEEEEEESKEGGENEGAGMKKDRVVVGSAKPTPNAQIHTMLPQDRGDDVGPPPPSFSTKNKKIEDPDASDSLVESKRQESNVCWPHSTDDCEEAEPFFQKTDKQIIGRSSSPPPSYKTMQVKYNGSIKHVMLPIGFATEDLADLLGSAFSVPAERRVVGLNVESDGRETVVPLSASAFGHDASVLSHFNNETFGLLVYPRPSSEERLDRAKWGPHDDDHVENAPGARSPSLVTFPPTPNQRVFEDIETNPEGEEIESSDGESNSNESEVVGDMGSKLVAFITNHVRQGTLGLVHARALLQHLLLDADAIIKWSQSISGEEQGGDIREEKNIYVDSVIRGAYTVALWTRDGFSLLDTLKRIAENLLRERRHEHQEVMLRLREKYSGTKYAVETCRLEEGGDDEAVSASTMMHSELEELIDCVDTLVESGELSFGHYLSLIDSILKGENKEGKEAILFFRLYQLEIINVRQLSEGAGAEEGNPTSQEKVVEKEHSGSSLHPTAARSLHDLLDALVQIGLSMKPTESSPDDNSSSSSTSGICENDGFDELSNKENVEKPSLERLDAIRDLSLLLLKNGSIMPAEAATMVLDLSETEDDYYLTKMEKYMAGLLSMNHSALQAVDQEAEPFNSEMHRRPMLTLSEYCDVLRAGTSS